MNEEQEERLVQSFERIAESLEKICVTQQRWCNHEYPERREPREAVVSRIQTEEDLAKERQGASNQPVSEWLGGFADEELVGQYEKAFLEEQKRNASSQVGAGAGTDQAGARPPRNKTRSTRKRTSVKSDD